MNLQALRALIGKDLRLFFADRRALMLTIFMPIGIASFFALVMGGSGDGDSKRETSRIPVMVVDQDNSAVSREIVARMRDEKLMQVKPAIEAEARRSVLKGETTAALILPPDFGKQSAKAMFAGEKPTVTLLYDPSHQSEMQLLRGVSIQNVMQVVSKHAFGPEAVQSGMLDEQLAQVRANPDMNPANKAALSDLFQSLKRFQAQSDAAKDTGASGGGGGGLGGAGIQTPADFKDEAVTAHKDAGSWSGVAHAFAGMAVQALLFWAIDAGIGILRERQKGLWKRLRAAPLSRGVLLGSKIGSTALISLLILAGIFGFGAVVFHVRVQGSAIGFLLVSVATALMAAAFGLLIAAMGKTEQQSRGYALPAVMLMLILGGAWFPMFLMPAWIQKVSLVVPSRWAVDGFDSMTWRGLGLPDALRTSAVLLAFAIIFGVLARLRFRWEME